MDEHKSAPEVPASADVSVTPSQAERFYIPPAPPPMQTVTKGWWVLRQGQVTVEELAKARRERR